MIGALLALLSAMTFGLNNATLRRGVLKGSVLQALFVTVPMGVPLFALAVAGVAIFADIPGLSLPSVGWFALAGAIHFVIGRYGNYRATRAMGSNLSGPVQQMSVVVALALAILFLGERLTPVAILGIVLLVVGPFVMMRGRGRGGDRTTSGFKPSYGEGLLWGGVCALGYGSSPVLIAQGLAGAGVAESMLGGLVSYAAASAILLPVLLWPGRYDHVRALPRDVARWFVLSGLFVFFSQVFRYAALALAPVFVVAPIQRLSVVFRVLFGWLINREHEVFGIRVLLGIGLSLLGAILLTLSVDWITALLPADLARMLDWTWP